MPRKITEWPDAILAGFHSSERVFHEIMKNYPYLARIVGGNLSSNSTQFSAVITGSTSISTKSSNYTTVISSTINWPGLDGQYLDEVEFGLAAQFQSTLASSLASTIGFIWQMKNATGSTWQNLHAIKTLKSITWLGSTMSGYCLARDGSLDTGYNRLPFNIRLRSYNLTAGKSKIRVKNSSYVLIKAKRV